MQRERCWVCFHESRVVLAHFLTPWSHYHSSNHCYAWYSFSFGTHRRDDPIHPAAVLFGATHFLYFSRIIMLIAIKVVTSSLFFLTPKNDLIEVYSWHIQFYFQHGRSMTQNNVHHTVLLRAPIQWFRSSSAVPPSPFTIYSLSHFTS